MHENEVNRRKKQIATLLYAADDMIEAEVAASWFPEIENPWRKRLVVTSMAVAYARVFVTGDYTLDRGEYKPADPVLADVHESLLRWRDKVYAHTDKESERSAMLIPGAASRTIAWKRSDFPIGQITEALTLFRSQRERFETEAEEVQRTLDVELAAPST
jgi:hypothetical protein